MNDGAGGFVDVAQMVGVTDRHDGRSVALADFGGRGALDVVVANQRGPLLLYKNEVAPDRQWIAFDLRGRLPRRRGRAEVQQPQRRSVRRSKSSGMDSSRCRKSRADPGFCSQNQRRLHFGLGTRASVDRVVIRWPSGKTQELKAPQPGRVHQIKEPV